MTKYAIRKDNKFLILHGTDSPEWTEQLNHSDIYSYWPEMLFIRAHEYNAELVVIGIADARPCTTGEIAAALIDTLMKDEPARSTVFSHKDLNIMREWLRDNIGRLLAW